MLIMGTGDTGLWRLRRTDCRRRLRATWIRYVVSLDIDMWGCVYGVVLMMVAMTASQMRIAETIDAFYGDAGTKDGVSRSYKTAVEDLDAETIKALDGPYR